MRQRRDTYWAAAPSEEFINEMHQRIRDFYDDLRDTGIYYLLKKSFTAFYGGDLKESGMGSLFESSRLSRGGKQGEITNLKTNHFRNLVKHTLQLATSQKPALSCRATNSDYKSQTQTLLATGILDFYMREKRLTQKFTHAVELSLVLGEGWIHCPWNVNDGEVIDVHPETNAPIHEGDLEFSVHGITDVVRDVSLKDSSHKWLCVRNFESKWDLAAKYPDLADDILLEDDSSFDYQNFESFNFAVRRGQKKSEDQVTMWTFYHEPSEAMPAGRMVQFVGDVVLFDGPLPYRKVPLYQCSPDRIINTPYGYSPAFELLGPQQAVDILSSTIMTNQATNGIQNIWTRKGDDLSVRSLQGGMKHISSEEMPQPLQLTRTAPEVFNFRNEIIEEMETLSGISSTVRGNPEANLKSGSALALVVSQSIQFSSLLEASYTSLIEEVGTAVINQLRDFSQTKRVASIIGESNRPFQKEFTSDDLALVNRVVVEPVNPLSKTTSGRIEIANNLLEKGFIENPKQYMTVLMTGNLDPAIEGNNHEMLNVRAENEALRNGEPVTVLITDHHESHIKEHKSLLANPEARRDPEFVARVLAHIQDHLDQWRTADVAILAITGQQPPPPPNGKTLIQEGAMPDREGDSKASPQLASSPNAPVSNPNPAQQAPVQPQMMAPNLPPESRMPNQPRPPALPSLPQEAPPEAQLAYEKLPK